MCYTESVIVSIIQVFPSFSCQTVIHVLLILCANLNEYLSFHMSFRFELLKALHSVQCCFCIFVPSFENISVLQYIDFSTYFSRSTT